MAKCISLPSTTKPQIHFKQRAPATTHFRYYRWNHKYSSFCPSNVPLPQVSQYKSICLSCLFVAGRLAGWLWHHEPTFIMSCLTNNNRNARNERISLWFGLGPSENTNSRIKLKDDQSGLSCCSVPPDL